MSRIKVAYDNFLRTVRGKEEDVQSFTKEGLVKNKDHPHGCTLPKEDPSSDVELDGLNGRCQWLRRRWRRCIVVSESNALSKVTYRSSVALKQARRRQLMEMGYITIHPLSVFTNARFILMTIVFYCSLFTYMLYETFYDADEQGGITVEARIVMLMNLLPIVWDIVMNFITGYTEETTRQIVLQPRKVARHYLCGYFLMDLLMCVPWTVIVAAFLPFFEEPLKSKLERAARILIIFKLVRVIRVVQYFRKVAIINQISEFKRRMGRAIIIWTLYVHIFSCFHFLIPATVHDHPDYPSNSWIIVEGLEKATTLKKYISGVQRTLFFSVGIATRESRQTWEDIVVTQINSYTGILLYIFAGVSIFHMALSKNSLEAKMDVIIDEANAYMLHKQLPTYIQKRLLSYYHYHFGNKFFNEKIITSMLTSTLNQEIAMFCCHRMVEKVELFQHLPLDIISTIVSVLKTEIFLPNDVVFRTGAKGDCMYFLSTGTMAVITPSGKEVCHLEDGDHFGEIALVTTDERRVGSIISLEISEVYRLDRRDFRSIILPYPALYMRVEQIARRRLEQTLRWEEEHRRYMLDTTARGLRPIRRSH